MEEPPGLLAVLEDARAFGFLGPGPIADQLRSGRGFAAVIGPAPTSVLDLGSGGGVPGLVVAVLLPAARVVLLDSVHRRCAFLQDGVRRLGLADRVEVLEARAEEAGRDPARRAGVEVVTARGFGPPAVTAECAAPFLQVGGRLVVAEPPEAPERWPADGLARLGLEPGEVRAGQGRSFRVLVQRTPCPGSFPRRTGVPRKRPLF